MGYAIVSVYNFIDEFCKVNEDWERGRLLPRSGKRNRAGEMRLSELLTIAVCYHLSGFKCFKYFYLYDMGIRHKDTFPDLLSYSRLVQVMPRLFMPLCVLLQSLRGEETGLYFMDSTSLAVCHNRRINRNRVFAGLAERGKTTMGWFYGFKLHLVIHHKGQIMAVKITKGNTNDREPVQQLTANLEGIIAADKGYLSRKLFDALYQRGLKLLTGIPKNMKNILMTLQEKYILRKRFLIKTFFGLLKKHYDIQHSRKPSPANAFLNTIPALTAFSSKPTATVLGAIIQN